MRYCTRCKKMSATEEVDCCCDPDEESDITAEQALELINNQVIEILEKVR